MSSDSMIERGLPSDPEAEKSILGAVLLNNELTEQVKSLLEVADFSLDSHKRILEAMLSLAQQGMAIDLITLTADLQARGCFEQVGGATYLASLIDGVPRADTIEFYARIVKHKAQEREAIFLCNQAIVKLADGEEDLETILALITQRIARMSERIQTGQRIRGYYPSLNDLFAANLSEPEEILCGIHRGEVGGLVAITNYGKSTLLFNTALALAAGQICIPLVPVVSEPRRVLYVDCESPASSLQADLQRMLRNIRKPNLALENFIVAVDAAINDEPLNLSRPDHFERVLGWAKGHRVDLVIVDTASSAFEIHDENNNAEVTRRVMNPLKRLARETDTAVIFTHHIGKANETQTGEGAYKGRGASAFGALARTVYTIEKDAKKGEGYIVLSCPKSKGTSFEPTLLKLVREARWFDICADRPGAKPGLPTAQEIAEFIAERESTTEEVCQHFLGHGSKRTITERVQEAERLGLIAKPTRKAPWHSCNGKNGLLSDLPLNKETKTGTGFVQSCNPISIARLHESGSNVHNKESAVEFACCPECGAEGIRFAYCERCGEFLR